MDNIILGIDFDNTIVCYDHLFHKVAIEWNLITKKFPKKKSEIKKYLLSNKKENIWTEMQGYVYGERILEAKPYPNALKILNKINELNIPFYIISHKTKYPYIGQRINLHNSAQKWIKYYKIDENKNIKDIIFNISKKDKIKSIIDNKCTHFIDDLLEIYKNNMFPSSVIKILFDPDSKYNIENGIINLKSWNMIFKYLEKNLSYV